MTRLIKLKGYVLKGSKLEKIHGYGLSVSQKLAQRKSKRVRVSRKRGNT